VTERGRVLLTALLLCAFVAPSAFLAGALLRAAHIEPATAAAVLLDRLVVASSTIVLLGFIVIILLFLFIVVSAPASWAQSRAGYASTAAGVPTFARAAIWVTGAAGIVVTLSVAVPGWLSTAQDVLIGAPDGRSLLWTAVSTAGFLGSVVLLRPLLDRRVGRLAGMKGVAAALLAPTVVLSSLELWLQSAYVPGQLEATISVEPALRFERSDGDALDRGTAEFVLTNQGETGTRLLISNFLICPRADAGDRREVQVDDPTCIKGVPPIGGPSVVEAKGSLRHTQVFPLPPQGSTLVQAQTSVAYARADRLILGEPYPPSSTCPEPTLITEVTGIHPILPSSRHDALLEPQYVLAYGDTVSGGRRYWVTTAYDFRCTWDLSLLLQFGIREMNVSFEEWITETATSSDA
jgi:hypothetical protein